MEEQFDFVIVGAGPAGANCAFELRNRAPDSRIALITAEPEYPYDRVPLSKEYLRGELPKEKLFFREPGFYAQNGIRVLHTRTVGRLDTRSRIVYLDRGDSLGYRKLLLATGGTPKVLPVEGASLKNVFTLRTIRDSDAIRHALPELKNVMVIGGGFIGCEIASSLSMIGRSVQMVEVAEHLLPAAVDRSTGEWLKSEFEARGVTVHTKSGLARILGDDGRVNGVQLTSGEILPAQAVVMGVGIAPNLSLAENAGLKVDKGVVTDAYLRTSDPDIFAAGDIARFYSPLFGRDMRVEHYDVAVKQGRTAAYNMTGAAKPFDALPYFFSYIFDLKIHFYGDLSNRTVVIRRGGFDKAKGFMQFYLGGDMLEGVLAVNKKFPEIKEAKTLVEKRVHIKDPSILEDTTRLVGDLGL